MDLFRFTINHTGALNNNVKKIWRRKKYSCYIPACSLYGRIFWKVKNCKEKKLFFWRGKSLVTEGNITEISIFCGSGHRTIDAGCFFFLAVKFFREFLSLCYVLLNFPLFQNTVKKYRPKLQIYKLGVKSFYTLTAGILAGVFYWIFIFTGFFSVYSICSSGHFVSWIIMLMLWSRHMTCMSQSISFIVIKMSLKSLIPVLCLISLNKWPVCFFTFKQQVKPHLPAVLVQYMKMNWSLWALHFD